MSVYIYGVEMPKEHPLYITLRPDGSVHVWDSYGGGSYGTQAVHVSEHGRLGDLDALEAKCTNEKGSYFSYEAAIIGEAVSSATTIISADPIKEETK